MKNIRPFRAAALTLAVFLALCQSVLATVSVTRGPYLQTGTPASVTVRWRTDVPTDSCVRYGASVSSLTDKTCEPTSTTEHVVELSSLSSNTQYYYSIGTSAGSIAGEGDSSYFFFTSPVTGTAKATRIWVLGDSGTAGSSARAVRDAYLSFTGSRHTDLWLMLGDNAYSDGTDSEYQAAVFNMYPTVLRKSVLWPTFGNHDAHSADSSSQSGPYYDIFTLPKSGEAGGVASGTEAYYSFNYANIHFVCLDSSESDRSPSGAMLTWLETDLAATTQQWLIAFWHHPPYSKGSHDSDADTELKQMRQYALPILEDYGVDLVLSGHSHSYERSYLLDGHYGVSSTLTSSMIVNAGDGRVDGNGAYQKPIVLTPHKGAVYTVAGSSGQTGGGALNHPAMYISLNVLGSLVLDINGDRLDAQFLNSSGSVQDYFTIMKGGSGTPPPTITSFTPTSGPVGTAVTITGTNFTGATQVTFFNNTPATFNVVSDTQISTTVPGGATTGKISVTKAADTGVSASDFTVTTSAAPPTITSFTPTSGPVGTAVTITGTNFTGATQVTFFNNTPATFNVVSDTQISTTVPGGATTGKISVTTPAGFADSASAFMVSPTITSFTPSSGPVGTGVTITGSNFTGATQVTFFNNMPATLEMVSDTQITTTVPNGATTGPISVATPAGIGSSASNFMVTASTAPPTITSFDPVSGPVDTAVTITGSNFTGATTVAFKGKAATTFTVDSDTQIRATVPSGAATGPISVTMAAGTGSSASDFTVTNLLLNPGFELDANNDGKPDSWSTSSKFTRSSTGAHSGTYAGKHFATSNSNYTISQTVTGLSAGTTYNFSGWVNIPPTTDTFEFRLEVQWRNASNSTISTQTIKTYNKTVLTWDNPVVSLMAPVGTTNAQVRMVVKSLKATIYVDDFVFRP